MINRISLLFFTTIFLFFACTDYELPKQKGFLRIEFEEPQYKKSEKINSLSDFYYNTAVVKMKSKDDNNLSLNYVDLNLSIDLTHTKIYNSNDLNNRMVDFNLILDTHAKKSNGLFLKEYENKTNNVFGKIYEIRGNVASPIQFYLTDSLSNFLRGSLNLNSSAKYDSIYPSIQYIKNDILVLFETINWKYNNETK